MCPSNERLPMRPAWPEYTVFRRLVLDVERRLLRALRRHPARLRPSFPPHPHPAGPRGVALSPGSLLRLPLYATLTNPQPRRRVVSHPALVDYRLGRLLLVARMDKPAGSRFAHWMRRPI